MWLREHKDFNCKPDSRFEVQIWSLSLLITIYRESPIIIISRSLVLKLWNWRLTRLKSLSAFKMTRKIDMTDNNYISWQRNREHWLSYNLKITYRKYIRLAKDSCMTLNDFHKTPSWLVMTYTLLPHPFKGLTHNLHKPSTWHLTGLQMTCIHNWQMAYKWLAMTYGLDLIFLWLTIKISHKWPIHCW